MSQPTDRPKPQGMTVNLEATPETLGGVFSNFAVIHHTESEFIIDFAFVSPQPRRGVVRARVILTPGHAKRFAAALQQNIQHYEKRFGTIRSGPPTGLVSPPSEVV